MRFAASIAVFMLTVLLCSPAQSTSCFFQGCHEYLIHHDLVVKGRALASGKTTPEMEAEYKGRIQEGKKAPSLPDSYTDFDVTSLYKGGDGQRVRVFYATQHRGLVINDGDVAAYPAGEETIVYATLEGGFYIAKRGLCTGCRGAEVLDVIKSKYDAIEMLIKKHPEKPEFYLKKIELYEGNRDSVAAVSTYERLFKAVANSKSRPELMRGYGRNLFLARRYEDAIKVLEPLRTDTEALSYLQQSRLHLGSLNNLADQKLLMSGKEIADLIIRDKDLSGSDFSGAKLIGVKFINVILRGANFENAQMHGEISGSDLSGARMDGVKFRGKITESKFDNAMLSNAELNLNDVSGNSFQRADFTSAKLFMMDCHSVQDWKGSDFTDARFNGATISGLKNSNLSGADFTGTNFYANKCMSKNQGIDLSGKKLDGVKFDLGDYSGASFEGASLRYATFIGDDLTGVNFRNADLTGANFTASRYGSAGAVKLNGADLTGAKVEGAVWTSAIFDCKTVFPSGFKPEIHHMQTKDRSCDSASLRNPGVVNYERDHLAQGHVSVCNGDYHADCIYGFLASYHVKLQEWSYQRKLQQLARSFLEAQYPDLAKIIVLKMIGRIALSKHSLDPAYFVDWLPIMTEIEAAQAVDSSAVVISPAVSSSLLDTSPDLKVEAIRQELAAGRLESAEAALEKFVRFLPDWALKENTFGRGDVAVPLADMFSAVAVGNAEAGKYEKAIAYAKRIGDTAFNSMALMWPADSRENTSFQESVNFVAPAYKEAGLNHAYKQVKGYAAAVTAIALERVRQGDGKAVEKYLRQASYLLKTFTNDDDKKGHLRALQVLSGSDIDVGKSYIDSQDIKPLMDAYVSMGQIDKVWDYYLIVSGRRGGDAGLDVLRALAQYYSKRPEDKGREKLRDLLVASTENIHYQSKIFQILGILGAPDSVDEFVRKAVSSKKGHLETFVYLHAAKAMAQMDKTSEAFAYFEKFCRQMLNAIAQPQSKNAQGFNGDSVSDGIGAFILEIAVSAAAIEDKRKALAIAEEIPLKDHTESPLFHAQLAIAKAAVYQDEKSGGAVRDTGYGNAPLLIADFLHRAGLHAAEKTVLDAAWVMARKPFRMRSYRTAYLGDNHHAALIDVARMLARDNHINEAERVAHAIFDFSAMRRIGGTDYTMYFAQQDTFRAIGERAAKAGDNIIALDIIGKHLSYKPYKAAIYFALADAAATNSRQDEARKFYNEGLRIAPGFADALGWPLPDSSGASLSGLVMRAGVEKKLGLEAHYARTLSFAKQAARVAKADVEPVNVALIVERIAGMASTAAEGDGPAQNIEDFVQSLNARDDLNSAAVVAELAEKYLKAGDKQRARAIAIYGLRHIDNVAGSREKSMLLLSYASLIARAEARMGAESQKQIATILREVHPNRPGGKIDSATEGVDLVAEGAVAYIELKRRVALDDAPPNKGDVLAQLQRNGSIKNTIGGTHLREWLDGAIRKYNAAHPEAVLALENFIGDLAGSAYKSYFLVTREIVLPTQLYGGPFHGRLVVPSDIPRPKGHRHESTIFYLSDFTCEGNFPPFCKY
jgi:uncharacterized protein YjbI with pentapeptide repeats/tetratricopeptide (TPR) repeat protein